MVNKIGIVTHSLYNSQLSYTLIKECNELSQDINYDIAVFYEELAPPIIRPNFGIFNACEMYSFDGILIATTIPTALSVTRTVKSLKKIFYIWDLEWLRGQNNYLYNLSCYQHPELQLICPSDDYAKAIENYCNIQPKVLPFNLKDIYASSITNN